MVNEDQNSAVYPLESEKPKIKSGKATSPLLTIERHRDTCQTPTSAFEAMKVHYDWTEGFELTEEAFVEAYEKWLNEPIGR